MKIKNLALLALFTSTSLFANDYGRGYSCPNGNCGYQGNQQQQQQRYYPEASGQAYYNSEKSNDNYSRYPSQNRSRDQQYNHNDGNYDNRDQQSRDGYYDNRNQQTHDGYYNPNHGQYNDNRGRNLTDDEVAKEVKNAVGPGWLSSGYPNVNFEVSNGTVNLRGSVKTSDDKAKIEDNIRKIDGVKQVNNQINVDERASYNNDRDSRNDRSYNTQTRNADSDYPQDTAATNSDREINEKLRNKLSGWFTKGFETITIQTTNGVITISGNIENPEDMDKIQKEAKKIEGVKSVNINVSLQRR